MVFTGNLNHKVLPSKAAPLRRYPRRKQEQYLSKRRLAYRRNNYFGVKSQALMDKAMHRAACGRLLPIKEREGNKAIKRSCSSAEQPFGRLGAAPDVGCFMVTIVKNRLCRTASVAPGYRSADMGRRCDPPTRFFCRVKKPSLLINTPHCVI